MWRCARSGGVPARTAELVLDGRRAVVAATTVYMNESGRAVAELVRRCRVDGLERIVVVHDELDLPVGRIKVKAGGGMAGHRGLKSIRDRLGSGDFTRVRIGIGRPRRRQRPGGAVAAEPADVVDYVLSRPGAADMAALSRAVTRAADAVECLAASGTGRAMELFNSARAL